MEYAIGLTFTAVSAFLAIWVNDNFDVGGELSE
ncbi:hypothetical protein BH11CYA1_BH11CYA1_25590 [soil metagenome]